MRKQGPKPPKPDEFLRFEELTRRLVAVPKREIEQQKAKHEKQKEKRAAK